MVLIKSGELSSHIIIVSPEPGNLKRVGLGQLADLLNAKQGGLGDISASLFYGLRSRGLKCSKFIPNFQTVFRNNAGLDSQQWRQMRHSIDPAGIYLVDSALFKYLPSIYGNKNEYGQNLDAMVAARFQENSRHSIKHIEASNGGRVIVDLQDQFPAGALAAYLKSRGIPVVMTMHNVNTIHIPMSYYYDFDMASFMQYLYFSWQDAAPPGHIDSMATGIKNATIVKSVGKEFLRRIAYGELDHYSNLPRSVIEETKIKYWNNETIAIPNSISPTIYPENIRTLPFPFSEETDDIIEAKNANKVELQKRTGLKVDPNALLYVSTSRLDTNQKGVQHFIEGAFPLIKKYPELQFFIIGDPIKDDFAESIKWQIIDIAVKSNGRIAYSPFNDDLSLLAYAAATDSFGASNREPFGQNDVIEFIHGGTATNTFIDGYKDKITPLTVDMLKKTKAGVLSFAHPSEGQAEKAMALIRDLRSQYLFGNGFLFKNSDPTGLKWGLTQSILVNRFLQKDHELANAHARLRMMEAKNEFSLDKMIDRNIGLYERIEKEMIDSGRWKSIYG
jgi:starch synthase